MEAARPQVGSASRKSLLGQLLMGVVALIVLAGLGYVAYDRLLTRPPSQPINGTPVKVTRGNIATSVAATGSIIATRQSRLTLQIAGKLKELPVKLGDEVQAGAVLARLDTAPLELKLAQARSALKRDQIKVEQLRAGARPEEIAQAEAAVRAAQGRLGDLQAGTLPQEIAQAQAAADSSAAQVRQAQAKLDALRVGPQPADVSAAEQQLKAAQANVDRANADLLRLKTPSDDELAAARTAVEKAQATLKLAQAAYDKVAWRPEIAGRPESLALQQATFDYKNALAQLNLKQQPRQTDVTAGQRALESAQAQVASAQAKIDQLNAGPTSADIRQAQAAIEAAQANYQQALARVETLKVGAKPGDVEAAQALVAQMQQKLALTRSPTTTQDVALADEQVNQSQLAIQQAQLDLDNATLTAPFDGVVGAISANVGEQVTGGTPVLTLVDPKALRVDVNVDETDVSKLAVGKPAQIGFDALPDKRYTGKVIGIAPSAVAQQGLPTYTVSVAFDDASVGLTPGLSANVGFVTADRQNVVTIPTRAIKRPGRSPIVDVLVGANRIESRPIKTGLVGDQVTEVVEGLAEGETVVIPPSAVAAASARPVGAATTPSAAPKPAGK